MYAGIGSNSIKADKPKHEKKLSYHSFNKKMKRMKAQINKNSQSKIKNFINK